MPWQVAYHDTITMTIVVAQSGKRASIVGNEITRTPTDVGRNRFIGFNPSDDDVFGGEKPRTRVIVVGAIRFFAARRREDFYLKFFFFFCYILRRRRYNNNDTCIYYSTIWLARRPRFLASARAPNDNNNIWRTSSYTTESRIDSCRSTRKIIIKTLYDSPFAIPYAPPTPTIVPNYYCDNIILLHYYTLYIMIIII